MQNKNSVNDSIDPFRSFAFWQGTGLSHPTSGFFTANEGMFTKEWHKGSTPIEWSFNFTLFDGNYLDKNSVRILFSSDLESTSIYIDESNATIRISNAIANISHINTQDYINFTAHTGTLYVFFVERENNRVPEKILPSHLKLYTMQMMFKSHESFGKSFSFSTTSMQDTYNVTDTDKIVIITLSVFYILCSFSTLKASKSIERKVSLLIWTVRINYKMIRYIILRYRRCLFFLGIWSFILLFGCSGSTLSEKLSTGWYLLLSWSSLTW